MLCSFLSVENISAQKATAKPNLIVIMTDDMGYADVGFNGCKDIPTPNIDRIANDGVKFTNGYTSYAVCGPSRAGFITGRYGQRFGFERNPQYRTEDPNMGLPKTEKTIAEHLQTVGYTSGIIGKWHLGAHESNHPLNRGFDEFFGHLGGGHSYFPENLVIQDSYFTGDEVVIENPNGNGKLKLAAEQASYKTWIMRNHTPVKTENYLTDEFSDEAVKFIKRNQDEPFFLYIAYNAPHSPLEASEKYLKRFHKMEKSKRKTYAAMVSAVDDGVGKVLNTLETLDLDKNTIVVFLSDNGGPETKNGSNNGVLREGKGSLYEGGYRVPFAMQWKGVIKKDVYDFPVSSLDILGTISALAEVDIDDKYPLDGVNLLPYLNKQKQGTPHQNIFIRKFDAKSYTVRDGDFKLVVKNDGKVKELYNLKSDISEKRNIALNNQKKVRQLYEILIEWDAELMDPAFLGLVHTKAWMERAAKNKKKKKKPNNQTIKY